MVLPGLLRNASSSPTRLRTSSALFRVYYLDQRKRVDARTGHEDVRSERYVLVKFRALSNSDCLVDFARPLGLSRATAAANYVIRVATVFARCWFPIVLYC